MESDSAYFLLLLPFPVPPLFPKELENEREKGQFMLFLSFFRKKRGMEIKTEMHFDLFSASFKKKTGERGWRKGYFSFDARGCEGHRRALGYCAKIVIYSDYLNKTACFSNKMIKYCSKNNTKNNCYMCVYFTTKHTQ